MDIQQQKQLKILVIGDSCKDIYHYGICERISSEAPIPIMKEQNIFKMNYEDIKHDLEKLIMEL